MREITSLSPKRVLQLILISVIFANMVMAMVAVFMYSPLLTMPHSTSYVLNLGAILLLYIFLIVWATRPSTSQDILTVGTWVGGIACVLEMVHILIENFGNLNARDETISTGIFMIVLFFLFAIAGYVAARKTKNIILGALTGSWSALVCMLIVTAFGLSQLFWSFQTLEKHNTGNPDFIRTGWSDLHAFVIADMFEAGFKVMSLGPIIGVIFGLLGATVGVFFLKQNKEVQ